MKPTKINSIWNPWKCTSLARRRSFWLDTFYNPLSTINKRKPNKSFYVAEVRRRFRGERCHAFKRREFIPDPWEMVNEHLNRQHKDSVKNRKLKSKRKASLSQSFASRLADNQQNASYKNDETDSNGREQNSGSSTCIDPITLCKVRSPSGKTELTSSVNGKNSGQTGKVKLDPADILTSQSQISTESQSPEIKSDTFVKEDEAITRGSSTGPEHEKSQYYASKYSFGLIDSFKLPLDQMRSYRSTPGEEKTQKAENHQTANSGQDLSDSTVSFSSSPVDKPTVGKTSLDSSKLLENLQSDKIKGHYKSDLDYEKLLRSATQYTSTKPASGKVSSSHRNGKSSNIKEDVKTENMFSSDSGKFSRSQSNSDSTKNNDVSAPVMETTKSKSGGNISNTLNNLKHNNDFSQGVSSSLKDSDIDELSHLMKNSMQKQRSMEDSAFHMVRAHEYSNEMINKSPRTIQNRNFFTRIDPPKPDPPKAKKQSKEFIIVTPSRKLIRTKTHPFKNGKASSNLCTVLSKFENPTNYVKIVWKLENKGWSCIGGGGPGQLIVFERIYDPRKRFIGNLLKITGSIVGVIGLIMGVTIMEGPF